MGKLSKKDKINLFFIVLSYLAIVLIITRGKYIFGSEIDWGFQHFVFPEYFRMLFYETGDLFPDFAFNIGGGQNIYYFAYYGLFSPFILFSYLLPFIPMSVYIPCLMILLGILSIYLFYIWLREFKFSNSLNFILTFMFALAGPFLFHSHRHIMFVSYMPFLILGLLGVRRFFSDNNKWLLMICIFLMIMTSYYYSVGGIFCLVIYGIYEYLSRIDKFVFKDFIKQGFKFAITVLVGVMMAGIILLPVTYVLMNGRAESYGGVSLIDVFTFKINLSFLLYDSYSVGLLAITFISIIYLIFKGWGKRFLGILLSLLVVCPIFVYMLNGGLYLDGKALIPFLPLYVLATGFFLQDVLFKKVDFKLVFLIVFISSILLCLNKDSLSLYFIFESVLFLFLFWLYRKYDNCLIIFIPLIFISFVICLMLNLRDNLISISDFKKQNDPVIGDIAEDIYKSDNSVYRIGVNLKASNELVNKISNINQNIVTLYSSTYNTLYSDFFYDFNNNRASRNRFILSEKRNILFESYMGVKYLITDEPVMKGYKFLRKYGNYSVYINEYALPLGYATNRVIGYDNYKKFKFPDDVLSLLGNVWARDGNYNYDSMSYSSDINLYDSVSSNLKIEDYKEGYKVTVNDGVGSLKLSLADDKLYLLRFIMDNPQSCFKGDTYIDVNGISNKLTCKEWKYFNNNYTFDYTLSGDLNITFSKGTHYIKKVEFYGVSYDDLMKSYENISPLENTEVFGDKISGDLKVKESGYFILSIPYDKGFVVKVDGKVINYEKVNKAFIGFPVDSGNHKIEVKFEAPYAKAGIIMSIIGFILFLALNTKKLKF